MDKDLFKTIDTIIREERLYAKANLMREDIMKRFNDAPAIAQAGSTYETRYVDAMRHAERRTPELVCKLKEHRKRAANLNSWKRMARAAAISIAALYAVAAAFLGIAFLTRRTRAHG